MKNPLLTGDRDMGEEGYMYPCDFEGPVPDSGRVFHSSGCGCARTPDDEVEGWMNVINTCAVGIVIFLLALTI